MKFLTSIDTICVGISDPRVIALLLFLHISLLLSVCAVGQHIDTRAKISKVVAVASDKVFFQIEVASTSLRRGDDIPLLYAVTNRGKRNVYLVQPPDPGVKIEDVAVIRLVQPVGLPDDHIKYNYELIKIQPGRTLRRKIPIPAEYYLSNPKYGFELANIQVGFSYLFDPAGLNGCREAKFVLPCLSALYQKSKSLTLGNLVVEIKRG